MKNINLTEVALLIVIGFLSFAGASQCTQKKTMAKAYSETSKELVEAKSTIQSSNNLHLEQIAFTDSINTELDKVKHQYKALLGAYKTQKAELGKITSDSLYMRLKGGYELNGKVYDIDSTMMIRVEYDRLELMKCREITLVNKSEKEMLTEALNRMADMNNQNMEVLDACEVENINLKDQVDKDNVELDIRKTKIRTNRILAGSGGLAFLLLVLL